MDVNMSIIKGLLPCHWPWLTLPNTILSPLSQTKRDIHYQCYCGGPVENPSTFKKTLPHLNLPSSIARTMEFNGLRKKYDNIRRTKRKTNTSHMKSTPIQVCLKKLCSHTPRCAYSFNLEACLRSRPSPLKPLLAYLTSRRGNWLR